MNEPFCIGEWETLHLFHLVPLPSGPRSLPHLLPCTRTSTCVKEGSESDIIRPGTGECIGDHWGTMPQTGVLSQDHRGENKGDETINLPSIPFPH